MLDWIFAPRCAACDASDPLSPGSPLCESCSASLDELGPACPRCAEPSGQHEVTCPRCLVTPLPLERIVAPWRFGGQLAVAIRRLKFTGRTHVARDVAPLWAPLVRAAVDEEAIVVPIPLHWRRRLARGFDHAWLLAVHACRLAELAAPVPALRRVRAAPPQSTLAAAERRDNLRGAFVVRDRRAVAGKPVVLVDDVVTTGATLAAAARALHAAGATRVVGVALARATSARG